MNLKTAAAAALLALALVGCGSSEPTTYAAVQKRTVTAVWNAVDRGAALEILKRWTADAPPDASEAARHSAADMDRLMPASGAVKGWERVGKPQPFNPAELETINGLDPERLNAFQFQSGLMCRYMNPRVSPYPLLRCVLLDMGTPENAFAYYASKRRPDVDDELFGSEGFTEADLAVFWEDRFCVETGIDRYATDTVKAMRQFSEHISGRIRGSGSKPAPIESLPTLAMNPRTPRWFRTPDQMRYATPGLLGLKAFQGAERGFTAWLRFGEDQKAPVLWAEFPSEELARKAFESFKETHSGVAFNLKKKGVEAFKAVESRESK
ncbi:MAG: hypothetical protein OXT69_10030 [Candidatus Poribacteria bacterium]|nr:hypothetical protein [Candidatus Poribacteria bacterium]